MNERFETQFIPVPVSVNADRSLSPQAKVVYAAILFHHRPNQTCQPSRPEIARAAGMSPNSVDRYIRELEEAGVLERSRSGLNRNNVYRLGVLPALRSSGVASVNLDSQHVGNPESPTDGESGVTDSMGIRIHNQSVNPIPMQIENEDNDVDDVITPLTPQGKGRAKKPLLDFPEEWATLDEPTPDLVEAALSRNMHPTRITAEWLTFRDYWIAEEGRKKDWPVTWRNWCGRAAKQGGDRPVYGSGLAVRSNGAAPATGSAPAPIGTRFGERGLSPNVETIYDPQGRRHAELMELLRKAEEEEARAGLRHAQE